MNDQVATVTNGKLHPQVEAVLRQTEEAGIKPVEHHTVESARRQIEMLAMARNANPRPLGRVEDRVMPTEAGPVAARFYWPTPPGDASAAVPIVLFYHGGGHVIGSPATHDAVARMFCAELPALVVSVDYRMGPEHRFPAAVDDSVAALRWVVANAAALGGDPARVAVVGDSAGGNLAAVAAIAARDGGPALRVQVLIYPVGDYTLTGESYARYAEGYGMLTRQGMHWFRDHYLSAPEDAHDWRASPLRADLAGVAPAIVAVAECDVLYADGVNYAAALRKAGVPVEFTQYNGMIHGFFTMAPVLDTAVAAQAEIAAAMRRALA